MKRFSILLLVLANCFLASCEKDETRTEIWTVASKMGIAHGAYNLQPVLLVKTEEGASWQPFFQSIGDFEYEEGYEYRLLVRINPVSNPPMDGSSLKYSMTQLLSKTPAESYIPEEYYPIFTMEISPRPLNYQGERFLGVRLPEYGVVTEWQPWPWPIDGFDYLPGYIYELRVGTSVVPKTPEGCFTVKYSMIELLNIRNED